MDPNNTQPQAELTEEIDAMARKAQSKSALINYIYDYFGMTFGLSLLEHLVAGKTTDYVNKMIEKHMK